jgi:gamma-glutamylcyclotransferase (GGCT)/AIG2-like uncharacterized protein YtfP
LREYYRNLAMQTAQPHGTLALFVYGTLMRASRHPFARRLAMESRFIGRATIGGTLYSLGRYPGLVEDAPQNCRVHGEVFRLKYARSFTWLDLYEGCGPDWPHPHEFERKMLPVRLLDGGEMLCWTYVYKGKAARFRWIPEGRFMPL